MTDNRSNDHPILVVVRGLPGSGKTYLASRLQQALGENDLIMLDPDATDYSSPEYAEHSKKLTAEGVDAKLHAYRFLREQAYKGIEGHKIIVWNQPFTNLEIFHKMIDGLNNYAAEHGTKLSLLVVEVEIDAELAKQRIAERKQAGGHGPSDNTFAQRHNDYKSFATEGFNTITVNGNDDASISLDKILSALNDLR